jgi:hypothetical protein
MNVADIVAQRSIFSPRLADKTDRGTEIADSTLADERAKLMAITEELAGFG